MKKVLVSRYGTSLLDFLKKIGYYEEDEEVEILNEVTSYEQIKDCIVLTCYKLPMSWLSSARAVVVPCFELPDEKIGKELTIEEYWEHFTGIKHYRVKFLYDQKKDFFEDTWNSKERGEE